MPFLIHSILLDASAPHAPSSPLPPSLPRLSPLLTLEKRPGENMVELSAAILRSRGTQLEVWSSLREVSLCTRLAMAVVLEQVRIAVLGMVATHSPSWMTPVTFTPTPSLVPSLVMHTCTTTHHNAIHHNDTYLHT